MSYIAKLKSGSKRFASNEEGNIFILFAFALVVLVAIAGAGVDLGRQQLESVELQQSADAASLAGASISANLRVGNRALTDEQVLSAASRYFLMNYRGDEEVVPRISLEGSGDNASLRVDTETQTITTSFVNQLGTKSLDARGISVTNASRSEDAQTYEVMLSIDVSYSMALQDAGNGRRRIEALQSASKIFIDDILPPENESLSDNIKNKMGGSAWGLSMQDTRPLANTDGSAVANQNAVMTSFVNKWRPLPVNNLDQLGTQSTVGFAHAFDTFKSIQSRPNVVRAVVLLTDGENNLQKAKPPKTMDQGNEESRTVCTALKSMSPTPVVIYTIAFGSTAVSGPNAAQISDFLTKCATPYNATTKTQYFYTAKDEEALKKVFSSISLSIRRIRIVQ